LKAANHYQIGPLAAKCEKILKEKSESDLNSVMFSYRLAETFNNTSLMEEYLAIMLKNGEIILKKPEFLGISHNLLCKLVKSDELQVPEKQVYLSCVRWVQKICFCFGIIDNNNSCKLRWGKAELQRRGINVLETNSLRKVLDPVHRFIRYPLLDQDFIQQTVLPDGLINTDESLELTLFFLTKEAKMLKSFVLKDVKERACYSKEVKKMLL
jgi:hypothetical protein